MLAGSRLRGHPGPPAGSTNHRVLRTPLPQPPARHQSSGGHPYSDLLLPPDRREKPLLDDWSAGWGIVSFERSAAVGFDINFDINCAGRPWIPLDNWAPKMPEIKYAGGLGRRSWTTKRRLRKPSVGSSNLPVGSIIFKIESGPLIVTSLPRLQSG